MSTTVCADNMESFISSIRNELPQYETQLEEDNETFNEKLNSSQKNLFDYIDHFIQDLNEIKKDYLADFIYLEDENKKTCDMNKQRFNELCIFINKHENDQIKVSKQFKEFKETFPLRPKMLKNVPEFDLQDININYFIKKKDETIFKSIKNDHIDDALMNNSDSFSTVVKVDHGSSPIIFNEQQSNEEEKSLVQNCRHSPSQEENHAALNSSFRARSSLSTESAFVPINSTINGDSYIPPTSSTKSGSIGHSYHKELASQNNPTTTMIESQSRSVSTASTVTGSNNNMVNMLFKIGYESNRNCSLMACNIDEDSLLIYSLITHKLEYLSIRTRQITFIYLPSPEPLLSLGYSSSYHCFYLLTKQTHTFVLFRLNGQNIEIKQEVNLTDENRKIVNLIAGHMYQNHLFFFYNFSSEEILFGKYNFEESTFIPSINIENMTYDESEHVSYEIIDFTVDISYITLLTRLKKANRYMLIVHDHQMNQINPFDLIDAKQPLSIVSTIQTTQSSATTICNEEVQSLLFINDPRNHIVHCCTHEQYLTLIEINAFGICSLNDGNLALVANKDIRGLKVQDYIKQN